MGLDIQITHSVEASDPEDWDRLSAAAYVFQLPMLQFLGKSNV